MSLAVLVFVHCTDSATETEVYAFHEDQTKFNLGAISDKDVLRRKMIQTYQVLEKAGRFFFDSGVQLRSSPPQSDWTMSCPSQTVKSLKMGNWPAPLVQLASWQALVYLFVPSFFLLLLSSTVGVAFSWY